MLRAGRRWGSRRSDLRIGRCRGLAIFSQGRSVLQELEFQKYSVPKRKKYGKNYCSLIRQSVDRRNMFITSWSITGRIVRQL